eukprot:CAMPEP_0115279538 /NCGR_PEP_ID=MMETSP0270-20121206/58313_1 /TAXON_ID=71861 /ORGANISM="Scrippsiella trochoidea, Strain CCMP3099" /LENGTH=177 /DNA_ID=CAMNT_0002696225 /DNA_START=361 /DNA_END=895 /DNA_ORIENTATION=-
MDEDPSVAQRLPNTQKPKMQAVRHAARGAVQDLVEPDGADDGPSSEEWNDDKPHGTVHEPRRRSFMAKVEEEVLAVGGRHEGAHHVDQAGCKDQRVAYQKPDVQWLVALDEATPLAEEVYAEVTEDTMSTTSLVETCLACVIFLYKSGASPGRVVDGAAQRFTGNVPTTAAAAGGTR